MTPAEPSYEYAEVTVGYFGRGEGATVVTFMQVWDVTGRKTNPDWKHGQLEALNMMGAQGWRYLSQSEATKGRMGWIWGELKLHDDAVVFDNCHADVYLMMRRVRD